MAIAGGSVQRTTVRYAEPPPLRECLGRSGYTTDRREFPKDGNHRAAKAAPAESNPPILGRVLPFSGTLDTLIDIEDHGWLFDQENGVSCVYLRMRDHRPNRDDQPKRWSIPNG